MSTYPPAPAEHDPASELVLAFANLGLNNAALRAFPEADHETPSAIKAQTIPALLSSDDIVRLVQIDTGKTVAFALPSCSALTAARRTPRP